MACHRGHRDHRGHLVAPLPPHLAAPVAPHRTRSHPRGPPAPEAASRTHGPTRSEPTPHAVRSHRQPAQLEREQLPQFDPPPAEPPLARPVVAKVEKILWHFFAPHSWQDGSSSLAERTRTSKRAPQDSQSYSNMGTSVPGNSKQTTAARRRRSADYQSSVRKGEAGMPS